MRRAHEAKALTPLGKDALKRIELVWLEAEGRGGDLSPLGVRQHRGIAERMITAYPQVFKGEPAISARSTIVMRCAMSMDAFCERLKEINPKLQITREASMRYMNYLNYHSEESNKFTGKGGPWHEEYRKFENAHTRPDRMMRTLFCDETFVTRNVNPHELMWGFYWLAVDMQDMETEVSFFDLFEPQELFDLWQCFNYQFYSTCANHADSNGSVRDSSKPLLRNIIESADAAIANPSQAATLRFAHDSNITPLAALMGIETYDVAWREPETLYQHWTDFKVSPMCANLQIVFFNKKGGTTDDILVKVLLNEHEVHIPVATTQFPYYRWTDVRAYYANVVGM